MTTTKFLIAVALASITSAADLKSSLEGGSHTNARNLQDVSANCCQFYNLTNFNGQASELCINKGEAQQVYQVNFTGLNQIRSVKCGSQVAAKLCPGDAVEGPVDGQRVVKYNCESLSAEVGQGVLFNASEEISLSLLEGGAEGTSVILNDHPWLAKGPEYIALSRQDKSDILWEKITESDKMGVEFQSFRTIDPQDLFDEWGDENDCRRKAAHRHGNVGKARWQNLGGHPYTGMFKGGDTGFVRLNTVGGVNEDVNSPAIKMNPAISVKFLRNGVDSGNVVANQSFSGQFSYNFFKNSLATNLPVTDEEAVATDVVFRKFKAATDFQGGLGNSEFALYDQAGNKEEKPDFPFRLRFEPAAGLGMPDDTYDQTIFEYFKTITPNQVLYKVMALDEPTDTTEMHIANIVLETQMVTSEWGDHHMYFRHTRMDDDIRLGRPHWADHVFPILTETDVPGQPTLMPQTAKHASACPLSFLWN